MKLPLLIHPSLKKSADVERVVTEFNSHQKYFALHLSAVNWISDGADRKWIDQNQLFKELHSRFGNTPVCVLVQRPLKFDLFADYQPNKYVISTADWKEKYAPPPVEIYLVFMLACGLVSLACELPEEAADSCLHDPNIGCISDYNSEKRTILFSMINAHICDPCKTVLLSHGIQGKALAACEKILQFVRDATELHVESELRAAKLIAKLNAMPVGPESANQYHELILEALTCIFSPSLSKPVKEEKLHDGRKRVDITFNNASVSGFFSELVVKHNIKSPYIFVECKNYSSDPANPELDQLAGRLSNKRGMFGLIVCRRVKAKHRMLQRCKDAVNDSQHFMLVLDDTDIKNLLTLKSENKLPAIENYMDDLFRQLVF